MAEVHNIFGNRTQETFEYDLNKLVDKKYTPGIDALLEVTYSKYPKYKNPFGKEYVFNRDVFEGFAGYKLETEEKTLIGEDGTEKKIEVILPQNIDFSLLESQFQAKLTDVRSKFIRLQEELNNSNYYHEQPEKRQVILGAIEYNLKLLDLAEAGFVFEMGKAGYIRCMTDQEVEKRIEKIESLETDIFGGKITQDKQESELCWQYMSTKFQDYKKMPEEKKHKRITAKEATRILTPEEEDRLEGYLGKIEQKVEGKGYDIQVPEVEKTSNVTSDFLGQYGSTQIDRDTYVHLFQQCINLLGLPQKVRVTGVTGIYDGPDYLDIPDNKKYETLSLERVMKLISHEIMGHYVNQKVHEDTFGKTRGAGNVEKEEGLAKFLDTVVLGGDVRGSNAIVPNMSRIFAGEILSPEEFEDFIDLYGEVTEKKAENNIGTLLRHKRNYPLNYRGVQHKDVTYSRGLIKVVNFLEEGGSIHELFQGKFSLEDIAKNMTGNGDFSLKKDGDFFNPVLITDIILFFMIAKTSKKYSFTHEGFSEYVHQKYSKYLSEDDLKSESISQISRSDLKQIFHMMSPLLQNITCIRDDVKARVGKIVS